jgi:regulator of sigma E protease
LGHFLAAKYFGVRVEEFGIGFPPRIFSKKIGDTRYSLNCLPLGGFVKLYGEFTLSDEVSSSATLEKASESKSFIKQKSWKKVIILVAGVTMNFLFGWLLLSLVFYIGAPTFILVNKILPDSPAAVAGILEGDQITRFSSAKEFTDFIKSHRGQEIILEIKRKDVLEPIFIKAKPEENLGVVISDVGFPAQSFFKSFFNGFSYSIFIMWSILIAIGGIFSAPESFVGPVGIFGIAIETGKQGFIYILQLLSLISLNLAVLNLLPIPALDGGRLFFILIEKVRGVAMSAKRELFWNGVGFIFLISLVIVVTVSDLVKLF